LPSDQKTIAEKRIAAATAYRNAGYYVFKLNGKIPPKSQRGWNTAKYDPKQDLSWVANHNYAVRLNTDDCLLDCDAKRYLDGTNDLQAILALLNISLDKTYVVRSGSAPVNDTDSAHVYFKKPEDWSIKHKLPNFPGIEIKTKGQYIVGPWSIHPDTGREYLPTQGWIGEVQDAPQELLDFLAEEETPINEVGTDYDDSTANKKRFVAYLLAAQPARAGDRNNSAYTVACEGRDYGLSLATCTSLVADYWNSRCEPELDQEELESAIKHAYQYGQNAVGSKNVDTFEGVAVDAKFINDQIRWDLKPGKLGEEYVPTLRNLLNFFKLVPDESNPNPLNRLVRFNEFANTIEFTKPAPWHLSKNMVKWNDADTDGLLAYLSAFKKYNCGAEMAFRAVNVYARQFPFHPVRAYLSSLSWDRIPRLERMLTDYAGVAFSPYVREVSRVTMIGAIARIFEPGCQFDTMTVLEGDQGNGKTNFVRVLGGDWYADVPLDPHNKDTIQKMLGHWILEVSEMEFVNRTEVNAIKSFLTIKVDTVRLPYARIAEDIPRQSIFIGTVNPGATGAYLTDATGNRRFLPVRANKIRLKALREVRDQLWAEAYYRYKKGEKWYIKDPDALRLAREEQSKREHTDMWTEIISAWIYSPDSPKEFETKEVALNALNLTPKQCTRLEKIRIAAIMKNLGYIQMQKRIKGFRRELWTNELIEDL
jgi:predicted P-loop ATPase